MDHPDAPVCVTGATGYLAGEIVRQLLGEGHRVRGTTRDPERAWRARHVTGVPGADERLELVEADLMSPGDFEAAVDGCAAVIHTASPYLTDAADPQRELVDPAVRGTLAVLEACAGSGAVRRVVITSSFAAMTEKPDGRVYDGSDWNTTSTLDRNPYYLAKVAAERAAWQFVEETAPGFDLVAINPPLILGPSLIPSLNTSGRVLTGLTDGTWPGIVGITYGVVDVRDAAAAHIRALERPEANGRYLTAAGVRSLREMVDVLEANGWGERYRLPSIPLDNAFGDALVKAAASFQPKGTRAFLRTNVGRQIRIDNSRVVADLGIEFRDPDRTILDAMEDLERWGHLGRKRNKAGDP